MISVSLTVVNPNSINLSAREGLRIGTAFLKLVGKQSFYRFMLSKGLHARIFFIVCIAALPLLTGGSYLLFRQTDEVMERVRSEATQYMQLASEYSKSEILGAEEALAAIMASPEIQRGNWGHCDRYFKNLLATRYNRYSNIGVIDIHGNLLCSGAVSKNGRTRNLADRNYFRLAMQRPGLVVGDFQTGRLTNLPSIAVATGISDERGNPIGVLFLSLRLSSLARNESSFGDLEAQLAILDRSGKVLTTSDPNFGPPGSQIDPQQLRETIAASSHGVYIQRGGSGLLSLRGATLAGPENDPSAIIVLYTSPGGTVFSQLRRDLWISGLIALTLVILAGGAGWAGTNLLIATNVRRLAGAADNLRKRQFHVRVAKDVSGSEFKKIAVQLDAMADELELRERDWQSSITRQFHQIDLLRRIAQNDPIEEILEGICKFSEEEVPGAIASLIIVDENGFVTRCISRKLPSSFKNFLVDSWDASRSGSCGAAIAERRIVISEDVRTDPLWIDYRDVASENAIRACWSYPILSQGNKALGSFALYFSEKRAPTSGELSISRMAAELATVAIDRYIISQELTRSELEYRSLFESNPSPMWIIEKETKAFLAVNDCAITHYGFSRNAFLNMSEHDLEFVPNIYPGEEMAGVSCNGIKYHRDSRGNTLQVELANFPTIFQGKDAVLTLISDVTYKNALTHTIHEQNELLSLLMNSTAEAIYGVDHRGKLTFANKACGTLLGYSPDELRDTIMHDLVQHDQLSRLIHSSDFQEIQSALVNGVYAHSDDEVLRRADGSSLPVEYWIYPIFKNNQFTGSIVTFLDVTERRVQKNELIRRATFDELTGLLNRPSFVLALADCLTKARRQGRHPAVVILDLDRFKEINDSLGHATGDKLLRQVADVMTQRNLLTSSS